MVDCNSMEVLFQRRCTKFFCIVPEGLRELMSDISREVLRCHPKELCCFIADYLDAVFISRENAKVAALLVEDVTEISCTLQEILAKTNLTLKKAIRAVRIIQRAFRRHLAQKMQPSGEIEPIDPYLIICKMLVRLNITFDRASNAASLIQQTWRCYKVRIDLWRARYRSAVDWRAAARYTLRLYKKYAADWEYTRAVKLIQAAYRGYYTRKLFKRLVKRKKKYAVEEVIEYLVAQYKPIEDEDAQHIEFVPAQRTAISIDMNRMRSEKEVPANLIQQAFTSYLHTMGHMESNKYSKQYSFEYQLQQSLQFSQDEDEESLFDG